MTALHSYQGSCHCGAIQVAIDLTVPADAIEVRACQCSFCRRHGGLTVSDPDGRVVFRICDRDAVTRYRFPPGTADFLICARCGVYSGALLQEGEKAWSVVNVIGLAVPGFEARVPDPAHYDTETPEGRIARRKARWTPTELHFGPGARPS